MGSLCLSARQDSDGMGSRHLTQEKVSRKSLPFHCGFSTVDFPRDFHGFSLGLQCLKKIYAFCDLKRGFGGLLTIVGFLRCWSYISLPL